MQKIILASQSPRRKQLLEMADIDFDIIAPATDERFPAEMNIREAPTFIAQEKAEAIFNLHPDRTILAADTVVILHNQLIGKPANRTEAIEMLSQLSAQTHEVITGVCIQHQHKKVLFSSSTTVEFHPISEAQIQFYVDRYQPFDKAGGYAIQEWIGAVAIKKIDGCFYNVMGLPISRVVAELVKLNLL